MNGHVRGISGQDGRIVTMAVQAVLLCAAVIVGADTASAQSATAPAADRTTRNISRRRLPADAKVIGLEYTVVTVDSAGNQSAVDPESHSFHIGDSFLVRIRPQDDVYVYVFTEGPKGDKNCLLPRDEEKPLFIKADSEITIPDDGGWFEFEPPAGEEKFVVIATKEPNQKLNMLASAAFRQAGQRLSATDESAKQQAEAEVTAIRERSVKGKRLRGPVKKMLGSLTSEFDQQNGDVTVVVPPAEDNPATEVVRRLGANSGDPDFIIHHIPLRSNARPAGN